ncbi:RabGAP/TBC [Heliocybe sulcata]|uniref:RabGAP/TBC n=1 Tax=Heliocybe sulcata TaxID=5364 RepID=A0A5C3NG46_9AGAM|nr:RabGAP/TBC [Heliocybe sulcata]
MDSDDEVDMVAAGAASAGKTARFDFDDAFSDGDDPDITSFRLDSAAIREELNKSLPMAEHWMNDEANFGTSHASSLSLGPDTSISTLDLDDHQHTLSPPTEYPSIDTNESPSQNSNISTPGLSESDHNFSQISLDDDHAAQEDSVAHKGPHEEDPHPYPAVRIDASEDHDFHAQEIALPHTQEDIEETPSPSLPPTPHSAPSPSRSEPHLSLQPPPTPIASVSNPTLATASAATATAAPSVASSSKHRPTRSVGPSILDKVVSKTRPPFLPPKNRDEDRKHMADWEAMMKRSRQAEEKRRKALQDRRLARERRIEESLHIWEKEVVPDWRAVHKRPELRKLWWGGIPTKLRASMWEKAVGNPLALSKGNVYPVLTKLPKANCCIDSYRSCLARARRAISSGTFPSTTLELLEDDIRSTLPSLHIFHPETGPMYQDLKDILCAWVVSRSDEGLGYTRGIAKVAGMFLINMSPPQAFVVMRNLLERHCLRSFYGGPGARDDVVDLVVYTPRPLKHLPRIFDTLLADGMPKIYFNFKQHQISPAAYLPDWLLPLFLDHLPFEACARIWDVLVLEGDAFLYRAALAILAVLESRLFFPDRKELLELLKGENKAALEVAKRDGRPLNGGKYEIYGVDEETLWERIDSMEDWWKESTWTRLIQRELPDFHIAKSRNTTGLIGWLRTSSRRRRSTATHAPFIIEFVVQVFQASLASLLCLLHVLEKPRSCSRPSSTCRRETSKPLSHHATDALSLAVGDQACLEAARVLL